MHPAQTSFLTSAQNITDVAEVEAAVYLIADVLHNARDALYGTRCRVAVAGGAARDIALGTSPRDIDLIVCPKHPDEVYLVLAALELGLGYKIEKDFQHEESTGLLTDAVNPGDYDALVEQNRWSRVVKLVAPGKLGIDVLVSVDDSLEAAIQAFDFNINQFAILSAYNFPRFFGEQQGTLVQNRQAQVSPERITHVQNIARAAGWSV